MDRGTVRNRMVGQGFGENNWKMEGPGTCIRKKEQEIQNNRMNRMSHINI